MAHSTALHPHVVWVKLFGPHWSDHVTQTSETWRPWEVLLNGMEDSHCRYSRSSSSSTGGGRAEGISWISRLLSSVDCMGPSWCCCWLTHECVKPPSSSGWAVGATATTGDRLNEERSQWQRFTAVWEKLSLTNEQQHKEANTDQMQSVLLTWSTFIVGSRNN